MDIKNRLRLKLNSYIYRRENLTLGAGFLKWIVLAQLVAIIFKVIGADLVEIESFVALLALFQDRFTDFFLALFGMMLVIYFALEIYIVMIRDRERKITQAISDLEAEVKRPHRRKTPNRHERYRPPD